MLREIGPSKPVIRHVGGSIACLSLSSGIDLANWFPRPHGGLFISNLGRSNANELFKDKVLPVRTSRIIVWRYLDGDKFNNHGPPTKRPQFIYILAPSLIEVWTPQLITFAGNPSPRPELADFHTRI